MHNSNAFGKDIDLYGIAWRQKVRDRLNGPDAGDNIVAWVNSPEGQKYLSDIRNSILIGIKCEYTRAKEEAYALQKKYKELVADEEYRVELSNSKSFYASKLEEWKVSPWGKRIIEREFRRFMGLEIT